MNTINLCISILYKRFYPDNKMSDLDKDEFIEKHNDELNDMLMSECYEQAYEKYVGDKKYNEDPYDYFGVSRKDFH